MQNILGEALATYNTDKINWCRDYMADMRSIVLKKFDAISAHVLEYIENQTKYTPEELKEIKNNTSTRKTDSNIRPEFFLVNTSSDLKLGIYGNIAGKAQLHKFVEFGGIACKTPRQYGN
jgi:hypothetical protein